MVHMYLMWSGCGPHVSNVGGCGPGDVMWVCLIDITFEWGESKDASSPLDIILK